ncbi:DUF523 domain-containing protein [Marinobacter sp. JSM 1782161]|uniref:DUF523 domain-containing protein n=1 Tax=Marinobacter sp. JSM 1782161 TaxID=2685906 RepID=UPI001403A6C5|nr:DUF523 domain-containing protein [Marinobacter sp. JSM 1782161]
MATGCSSDPARTSPQRRVLISACLLGENVRYDGGNLLTEHPVIRRWHEEGRVVQVCPEVAGGLPTPRPPAEARGGDGRDVLAGRARIIARDGEDVTDAFVEGASLALRTAEQQHCVLAVLAARSPSCGNREVYDGSFSGRLMPGMGTAAARLEAAGIAVFNQNELEAADARLRAVE